MLLAVVTTILNMWSALLCWVKIGFWSDVLAHTTLYFASITTLLSSRATTVLLIYTFISSKRLSVNRWIEKYTWLNNCVVLIMCNDFFFFFLGAFLCSLELLVFFFLKFIFSLRVPSFYAVSHHTFQWFSTGMSRKLLSSWERFLLIWTSLYISWESGIAEQVQDSGYSFDLAITFEAPLKRLHMHSYMWICAREETCVYSVGIQPVM